MKAAIHIAVRDFDQYIIIATNVKAIKIDFNKAIAEEDIETFHSHPVVVYSVFSGKRCTKKQCNFLV